LNAISEKSNPSEADIDEEQPRIELCDIELGFPNWHEEEPIK